MQVLCYPITYSFPTRLPNLRSRLYRDIVKTCPEDTLKTGKGIPKACSDLLNKMSTSIGGYYSYNLYDTCYVHNLGGAPVNYWSSMPNLGGALNDYPCPGMALALWLNRTDSRAALGVPADANYFSGDNGVGFNYSYV